MYLPEHIAEAFSHQAVKFALNKLVPTYILIGFNFLEYSKEQER